MNAIKILILSGISLLLSSCAMMFEDELVFNEERVPGSYEGEITCSYDPCEFAGPANFTITENESYFTLSVDSSHSLDIPPLDFQVKLDGEKLGEAKTITGFIEFHNGQEWKLTPYDQHIFSYWTYFDTQQEGERFEIKIYKTESDEVPQNFDYLELNGFKGVQ